MSSIYFTPILHKSYILSSDITIRTSIETDLLKDEQQILYNCKNKNYNEKNVFKTLKNSYVFILAIFLKVKKYRIHSKNWDYQEILYSIKYFIWHFIS